MKYYADTNFFTRLYLELPDSTVADALIEEAHVKAEALPVTWLLHFELINAFQLHVFAGRTLGQTRVTPEQAATAQAHFRSDLANRSFLRHVTIEPSILGAHFEELALRHTAKHGFRTYDLLHVAMALALGCDTFWSFDPKAAKLARLEGLTIL